MKTERKAKISFGKMGNGKGSRVNLSIPLLKTLGITEENREFLILKKLKPIKSVFSVSTEI